MENTTSDYLKKIGRRKLLTKEQEIELSKAIELGRTPDDPLAIKGHIPSAQQIKAAERAKNRMIECNLRLVVSIAKSYQSRGCELDDLIAAGNIGLMKAVERFDYSRGFRFSTYGSWWIRQAVGREVASQGRSIRVPGRATTFAKDLNNIREDFIEIHGQEPTRPELAELLGVTETTIASALEGAPVVMSFEDNVGFNGDKKLHEVVADEEADTPFDLINKKQISDIVQKTFATLNEREEKILRMRFGIGADPTDHENFPITYSEINIMKSKKASGN